MWPKIKKSPTLNLLLILAAIWVGYGSYKMISRALALQKEAGERQKEVEELARKKAELEAYLAELQSQEALIREAKSRFNLKLPGEEVVVVVPPEKNLEETKEAFWERIKSFFHNLFKP